MPKKKVRSAFCTTKKRSQISNSTGIRNRIGKATKGLKKRVQSKN